MQGTKRRLQLGTPRSLQGTPRAQRVASPALTSPRKVAYRTAVVNQRRALPVRGATTACGAGSGPEAWRSRCAAAGVPAPPNSVCSSSLATTGRWRWPCSRRAFLHRTRWSTKPWSFPARRSLLALPPPGSCQIRGIMKPDFGTCRCGRQWIFLLHIIKSRPQSLCRNGDSRP